MDEPQPQEMDLGKIAGLELTAANSALLGSLALWLVLGTVLVAFLHFAVIEGVTLGLVGVLLHWIGEFVHQVGHARAARKAGYPMIGVRFWGLLSSSLYPADEPAVSDSVHLSRALGGPILSFILSIVSLIVLLILPVGTYQWYAALFFTMDNFFTFTLGALLPLGFTDGSTILRLLRK